MKKNRSGIVIIAIALTILTAGVVFAYGGYGMHHGGWSGYSGHMVGYGHGPYMHNGDDWGGLSEEQSAKLYAVK